MHQKPRVICIIGPTASGKTALSVQLAKRLQTEIVSADSVQIFREMDIGSAKPTEAEREGIPHHLIDTLDIDTPQYSVSMFRDFASPILDRLHTENKTPLVVGGSGLYISAIVNPLEFAIPSDSDLRKQLEEEYRSDRDALFKELQQADPLTAARLHPNDEKRIVRAMEVFRCSGKPLSSYGNDFRNDLHRETRYDSLQIGLMLDREVLYDRIDRRVDLMMENGLLEEAKQIYMRGYDRRLPAMLSIGYRQLFQYFDGLSTLEEAVHLIKRETRRFAKRQMTWFQRDTRIQWIPTDGTTNDSIVAHAERLCKAFIGEKQNYGHPNI